MIEVVVKFLNQNQVFKNYFLVFKFWFVFKTIGQVDDKGRNLVVE